MKKLITILLAVLLIIAMAVPVFADSSPTDSELVANLPAPFTHNYYIVWTNSNGVKSLVLTDLPLIYFFVDENTGYYVCQAGKAKVFDWDYETNSWKVLLDVEVGFGVLAVPANDLYLSSYPLYDETGFLWRKGDWVFDIPRCDGITCVTSDTDYNGLCDNCGKWVRGNPADSPDTPAPVEYCTSHYPYKNGVAICPVCGLTRKNTIGAVETIYGYDFPALSSVWADNEKYTVATIYQDKASGAYHLVLGAAFENDYCYTDDAGDAYYKIASAYAVYDLDGNQWRLDEESTGSLVALKNDVSLFWASETIYTDSSRVHDFFFVPPTMAGSVTETMIFAVFSEIVAILPIMTVFLVGYLALRKALRVLEKVLYQA